MEKRRSIRRNGEEIATGLRTTGEMITPMRANKAWDASGGIGRMGIGRDSRTALRVRLCQKASVWLSGSRMRCIIVGFREGTPDANGFGVEIPTHGVARED